MRKRIAFYALFPDFADVLGSIEAKHRLQYLLAGEFSSPEVHCWSSYREIPELDKATGPQPSVSKAILILPQGIAAQFRPIMQASGGLRFSLDQLMNPASIVFDPGGRWKQDIILAGSFGTASEADESQKLMRLLSAAIRKTFTKVRGYWVGHTALGELRSGKRLTIAEQSPPGYDLQE